MFFRPFISLLTTWLNNKLSEEPAYKYLNDITSAMLVYIGALVEALTKPKDVRKEAVNAAWKENREAITMASLTELSDLTEKIKDPVDRETALAIIELVKAQLKDKVFDKLSD